MNLTGNGKIARLPREIRERLNRRILDGEKGKSLVAWLNSLPEVQAVMAGEFGGKPVREQNLSEWRQGGYRGWLAAEEAREVVSQFAENTEQWNTQDHPPLTDVLALWAASHYAIASRKLSETDGPEGWRLLREMCHDIVELRRGDHSARRIEIERERVAAETPGADRRFKRDVIKGLETLGAWVKENPQARAAFDELLGLARHPFDPSGAV